MRTPLSTRRRLIIMYLQWSILNCFHETCRNLTKLLSTAALFRPENAPKCLQRSPDTL